MSHVTHGSVQPWRMFEFRLEVVEQDFQELNLGHKGNGHSSSLGVTTMKGIEYHCVYTVHVQADGSSALPLVCDGSK